MLRRLEALPGLLVRQRRLIAVSVARDLAARFSGTVLGRAWPLVQPLVLFVVYAFVFTRLFGVRLPEASAGEVGGAGTLGVYMFIGVLVWSSVAESLSRSAQAICEHGNLIGKVAFPAELLPLQVVLSNLVTLGLGLGVFVAVAALAPFDTAPPAKLAAGLAWIPVLVLAQVVFVWGLGLAAATLQVYLRDTAHVLGLLLTLGMFATPIFWVPSAEFMPAAAAHLDWITASPFHHLVQAWRQALMGDAHGALFTDTLPRSVGVVSAWALVSFLVGHALFTLGRPGFADEV